MWSQLLVASFLLAHAAIHAAFLAPRPATTLGDPAWPFDTSQSWAVSSFGLGPDVARLLAFALFAASLAGFAMAALAVMGLLPGTVWIPAVAVGAMASIALLGLFFHPWLVLGLVIDAALLWAVLVAGWTPGDASLPS